MGNVTHHPAQGSGPAHMVEGKYLGADAALNFGDPAREFAALRETSGLFLLTWRKKIEVTGKDRVRWLHNMVTNNVRDLAPNRGNYNFVLNAQGRILGDIYIFNRGESLVIDTDAVQVEPLLAAMKRFIIMDKVEMNVLPTAATGICGAKAEQVLASSGKDLKGMEPLEIRELGNGHVVVRGPANKPSWYEIWQLDEEDGMIGGEGVQLVGTQALEWWRIVHGIPQYGQDIRDRDLPQETEQIQALNFTKGCYIGQEIVERIRSRGQVHRKFTGFEFEDGPPVLGKAEAEGRVVAEVTSIASVPTSSRERNIGLGYVRREAAATGSQVDLGGHKARIVDLPFTI